MVVLPQPTTVALVPAAQSEAWVGAATAIGVDGVARASRSRATS